MFLYCHPIPTAMQKCLFRNIIGEFVFDENFNLVSEKPKKGMQEPKDAELRKILSFFKQPRFFKDFRIKNVEITKKKIKESVNEDLLIIQAVSSMNELDKVASILIRRLREWYSLYNPEFSCSIENNEKFVELILKKEKKELLKELKVRDSMGADLKKDDIKPIENLSKELQSLYKLKEKETQYLENLMASYCRNIMAICPVAIAAQLLRQAGSLKRLATLPSSTIQLLGAEKALFRHLRNKKNAAPKYGFLHEHPLVSGSRNKGKAARILADKISIASRVDYFKGRFIGDKLKKEVEAKLK